MSIAQAPQPAGAVSREDNVRRRLETVRRATIRQRTAVAAGRTVLLLLVALAGLAALDYVWVIGMPWRAAGLAAGLLAIGIFALRLFRESRQYGERDAAADVEARFPHYGQRIRTSRDYDDPQMGTAPAAPGLVGLLLDDTRQRTFQEDFRTVVSPRPLRMTLLAVGAALLIGLAFLLARPELWISLGRVLLLPLHYTQVTVQPLEEPVPAGQDARILAEVRGRPVRDARLLYRAAGSQEPWSALPLLPQPLEAAADGDEAGGKQAGGTQAERDPLAATAGGSEVTASTVAHSDTGGQDVESGSPDEVQAVVLVGPLQAVLENCQADLDYKVVAGPLDSPTWRLRVLQPLTMQKFSARVEPPAYTHQEPRETESMDLRVIEGSNVRLQLVMSREAAEANLVPLDDQGQPLDGQSITLERAGTRLSTDFSAFTQSGTFYVAARTDDGMSFESSRIRIQVVPDERPKIRFVKPPEDLEVTPTTEVTLAVEASDDFGLKRIGVACKVADGPLQTLWSQDFASDEPRDLQMQPVLSLENYPLTYQDAVTYYAFVEDNCPGGLRRTTTELRFIDIRPYKREYQIMPASGGT